MMSQRNLDSLLVLIAENRRYLSGFTGEDSQFDESAGALILTQSRKILVTDTAMNYRPNMNLLPLMS
jgi:Xaa-Pro aminopeptidase